MRLSLNGCFAVPRTVWTFLEVISCARGEDPDITSFTLIRDNGHGRGSFPRAFSLSVDHVLLLSDG
jgi:hypothetical protein